MATGVINQIRRSLRLHRFELAQDPVYDRARRELGEGAKRGHWMWFVFPQLLGLGRSDTARRFAITSLYEARAYLQHPILGSRLRECTQLVLDVDGRSALEIFGYTDSLKFRSSMTLFALVAEDDDIFEQAICKYYRGLRDPLTLKLLEEAGAAS